MRKFRDVAIPRLLAAPARPITALVATGVLLVAGAPQAAARPHSAGPPPTTGSAALATSHSDFDGDGIDDVVAYAWPPSGRLCLHIEYSSGIPLVCPQPYPDQGGQADNMNWTSGDFNGDGYDDLVLGEEDMAAAGDGRDFAGRVEIYYGSNEGLSRYQVFTQDTPGIRGTSGANHQFGEDVSTGDVNGDGFDDLLISAPYDRVVGYRGAGSVVLLYGSATGLSGDDSLRFAQNHAGVPGQVRKFGSFGSALAIEDVTGDGLADVAVSSQGPGDELVSLFRGGRAGLRFTRVSSIDVGAKAANSFDLMVGGDFNGDGYGDLVGGAPRYSPGGVVAEMLGGPGGIRSKRFEVFRQGVDGIPGHDEETDFWGWGLVAADLTGDGRDDLLVANPSEVLGGIEGAGSVTLIRGSRNGLTSKNSLLWTQGSPGVCGSIGDYNSFGEGMTVGHFADPERWDALISAPEDRTGGTYAGLLVTVHGGATPSPDGCTVGIPSEDLGWDLIGATY